MLNKKEEIIVKKGETKYLTLFRRKKVIDFSLERDIIKTAKIRQKILWIFT